ncbi:DUF3515 family protein [Streptomyces sp. SAJ15]|uniref:DUF3515 family protein n=1 Tax=Streptomyces sp. SAJ15 TaxID=2011095 RepID=UPI001184717F|nr:DUF3515 family protein [Streptomyces sp. SAJ15]
MGASVLAIVAAAGLVVHATRSSESDVEGAPRGDHRLCERIAEDYPDELLGESRSDADLPPGVAVWGDETVVLRCGMEPPRPTVDPCFQVDGVDWVLEEAKSKDGTQVLISYGRNPAVEVVLSDAGSNPGEALVDLSRAVSRIRQGRTCI